MINQKKTIVLLDLIMQVKFNNDYSVFGFLNLGDKKNHLKPSDVGDYDIICGHIPGFWSC